MVRAEHLYIHVPFCARRCAYCDFSIAVRRQVPVDEYLAALEREFALRDADSAVDLDTLYLGGGTPSKLGVDGVTRLLDLVRQRVRIRPDAEVTLEANPEDVTPTAARAWASAGVNRVSLGVQSFSDAALEWMHRTHTADQAGRAIHVLHDASIGNLSIDLIFGVPRNVSREWQADLDRALSLAVPHISVYGLTVEPHTPLGRWVARDDVQEVPEETFEAQFLAAHATLSSAGFEHYEVSNYGLRAFQSRHNWAYWRRIPYMGLGPSAHEFDGSERSWNTSAYSDWVARLSRGTSAREGSERLDMAAEQSEALYLGLRTSEGVEISTDERPDVARWVEEGWAVLDERSVLRLTAAGWLRLDALAGHLTRVRSRSYI